MQFKSLPMVTATLLAVSLPLASGCTSPEGEEMMTEGPSTGLDGTTSPTSSSGEADTGADGETSGADDGMTMGDTTTSDATTSDDGTTTGMGGECETYRSMYPAGPYGTGQGDVLMEMPGMVLPDGTMTGLNDIYADKSKIALMLVNAFDT